MNEFKIEKGIPIPPRNRLAIGVAPTLRAMKVGDSVVLPKSTSTYICHSAKDAGIKVTQRRISDTEIRVWRIA